jgi:hypothetical protein
MDSSGNYIIVADVYEKPDKEGKKIGSSSAYFSIPKDYLLNMTLNNPNGIYSTNENLSFNFSIANIGNEQFNSEIIISIPELNWNLSKVVSIEPKKKTILLGSDISLASLNAGSHNIIAEIKSDNAKKKFFLCYTESKIISICSKKELQCL